MIPFVRAKWQKKEYQGVTNHFGGSLILPCVGWNNLIVPELFFHLWTKYHETQNNSKFHFSEFPKFSEFLYVQSDLMLVKSYLK